MVEVTLVGGDIELSSCAGGSLCSSVSWSRNFWSGRDICQNCHVTQALGYMHYSTEEEKIKFNCQAVLVNRIYRNHDINF